MGDPLYARFNARGHKQFKGHEAIEFEVSYPDYSKIGLPAHKAALDGNLYCLRDYFLSKHQKNEGVPSRDVNGATPLHLAARTRRIEVLKWLLRFTDLSPVTAAKHGETPVHVAAALGHVECLKVLITADGKSDVKSSLATAVDNSGFTALHLAIVKSRNECAKLLLNELGTKGVGALNESGITAAHVAASSGNVDILKLLSHKYKKLVTQQASDGTTPVYFAAQEGRLEAMKFLATKLKCDLSTPSNDGLKPIHAAAQCGHTHIVKYIVSQLGNQAVFDHTPEGATSLHFAASSGQLTTARWLLNCDLEGTLIITKDKNGDTAAHDAADSGQTVMLKFLLESGADLYAINNEGNTPYSLALSGQDSETANFVMTYASKAPQKQETGPSQMTIYDLQGDVDVVNLEAAATGPAEKGKDEPDLPPPPPPEPAPKKKESPPPKKKANKKAKKEKEKEKGKKKSRSGGIRNTKATTEVLKSLDVALADHEEPLQQAGDQGDLDMTDEDLAQFQNDHKPEDEEIVVRYTSPKAPPSAKDQSSQLLKQSDYSTVSEIEEKAAKKKKKKDRNLSKSIQNVLKSNKPAKGGKKVADSSAQPQSEVKKAFSGPEMGFKPQFKHNPLQNIPSITPATPPPTPATGASIAPSDENPQSNPDDAEDEDDGNPYDSYSSPNVALTKPQADESKPVEDSENKKLLGDALEDLADEDSPPSPSQEKSSSSLSSTKEEQKPSPKLKPGIWPPPAEDTREPFPEAAPPAKSGQPTVLKKWQPKEWKKEGKQPPPAKMDLNSWAKNVKHVEVKRNEALTELQALKKPSPIVKELTKEESQLSNAEQKEKPLSESPTKKFAALKPVKRDTGAAKQQESKNALPFVKLKKAEKQGANFDKPGTDVASGASDELLHFLKGRQN